MTILSTMLAAAIFAASRNAPLFLRVIVAVVTWRVIAAIWKGV